MEGSTSIVSLHFQIHLRSFVGPALTYVACFAIFFLQLLQDKVDRAMDYSDAELMSLGREIVDFHGEMVLLENYSALNYTGMF